MLGSSETLSSVCLISGRYLDSRCRIFRRRGSDSSGSEGMLQLATQTLDQLAVNHRFRCAGTEFRWRWPTDDSAPFCGDGRASFVTERRDFIASRLVRTADADPDRWLNPDEGLSIRSAEQFIECRTCTGIAEAWRLSQAACDRLSRSKSVTTRWFASHHPAEFLLLCASGAAGFSDPIIRRRLLHPGRHSSGRSNSRRFPRRQYCSRRC